MAQQGNRSGAHFKQGPAPKKRHRRKPTAQQQQQHRPSAQAPIPARPQRRRSKAPVVLVIVFVLLAALGVGGFFAWQHRPVTIVVDGERRTVFRQTSLADFAKGESPSVDPGNYVSVTGNVLREGKGNPYSVSVNGKEVGFDDTANFTLNGGEAIEFADGGDVMEEHTTETTELQPKLEFKVKQGTAEKGLDVQHGVVQYVAQWGKVGKHEIYHGKESGETSDGKVVEPAQNCIVIAQDVHPDNDEKIVALTFDDGPTNYTEPCLRILAENDVRATFNIIGEQTSYGASVVTETAEAGHVVASHSWDHPQLTKCTAKEIFEELSDTAAALKKCVGKDCTYLRPPYGSIDEDVWLASKGTITASFYWTHDSDDWATPGVQSIVSNSTLAMKPGSVILMHDGGGDRSQTMEALPQIISAWKSEGYRFVTVDELIASDSSIDLSAVKMGTMPADCVWPTEMA